MRSKKKPLTVKQLNDRRKNAKYQNRIALSKGIKALVKKAAA